MPDGARGGARAWAGYQHARQCRLRRPHARYGAADVRSSGCPAPPKEPPQNLQSHEIAGYDAILCCESLEHIEWERVGSILSVFHDSGAKYLIVSVPDMGFQVYSEIYFNRATARQYFSMKKLLWRKECTAEPPGGHQWEVGYKDYPLRKWERRLKESGWSIVTREFTEHC